MNTNKKGIALSNPTPSESPSTKGSALSNPTPSESPSKSATASGIEPTANQTTSASANPSANSSATPTASGIAGIAAKCIGSETCVGDLIAGKLSKPGEIMHMAKGKIDEGLKDSVKLVASSLTNPVKCAALAVGAVPSMITGIGKSISGAFDGITDSINNTFIAANNKGYSGIFGPIKIAQAMFLGKLQGVINDIALGHDAEKILSDPKMTAKILFDKLVLRSKMYKLAVEDAQFRGVFKEWITEYVNTLMTAFKIAQPEIDRINKEVKYIIEGAGDNIGESLGHALTNVIVSVISAVPVVGWIAPVVKTADELGRGIIKGCHTPITQGAGVIMPVVNEFNKQKSQLKCEVKKLEKKIEPMVEKFERQVQAQAQAQAKQEQAQIQAQAKQAQAQAQAGGGNNKKTKRKIYKATKRVNVLLNRFSSKQNQKINYTRRLNRGRF